MVPLTAAFVAGEKKDAILVVDDEPIIRQTLTMLLTSAGYEVAQAEHGFDAEPIHSLGSLAEPDARRRSNEMYGLAHIAHDAHVDRHDC